VKVFSARQPSTLPGEAGGYTSDESQGARGNSRGNSRENSRSNTRRHKLNKKEKIIWA